jgi:hypothetical protein
VTVGPDQGGVWLLTQVHVNNCSGILPLASVPTKSAIVVFPPDRLVLLSNDIGTLLSYKGLFGLYQRQPCQSIG